MLTLLLTGCGSSPVNAVWARLSAVDQLVGVMDHDTKAHWRTGNGNYPSIHWLCEGIGILMALLRGAGKFHGPSGFMHVYVPIDVSAEEPL